MLKYEQVLDDEIVLSRYKKVEYWENNNVYAHSEHSLKHVLRVVNSAEKLARLFCLSEEDINLIKIASLLHDVGADIGKEGHAERGVKWVQVYLQEKDLSVQDKAQILTTIKNHSDGGPSVICKIVSLADKLDIIGERFLPAGRSEPGCRQFVHVLALDFKIEDNILMIMFTTDGKIDIEEINLYYFVPKIFSTAKSFAEHFGLASKLFIDDKIWQLK